MSPPVFISHSSADRDIAAKLCEALERRGLGCWLASRDIGPGENFQESIVKAIRSVRTMVLVFTDNANNSGEIKKELALASQNHLVVIPLRVEDVLPNDAFLYEFSTRQWIDAFDDWDAAIGNLADRIGALIGEQRPASEDSLTAPGRSPPTAVRLRRVQMISLAASVAILVGAGFAYWILGNPSAPSTTSTPAVASQDISGKWITGPLTNPYDRKQKSILQFEFQQSGDTLFGTVREKSDFGGSLKGIHGGQVKGNVVTFHTQGMTTTGTGTAPYKEHYRGTLKGSEITFVRQNDVASGGLPQNFTARRE